jgi:hypothetical protein
MGMKRVELRYGTNYANSLQLNAALPTGTGGYVTKANDLWGGLERQPIMSGSTIGAPSFTGGTVAERPFSLTVRVAPYDDLYSPAYNEALNALKTAFYRPENELVRVVIEREGVSSGYLYLDAFPEQIREDGDEGDFELLFTAPDGVFTLDEAEVTDSVDQPGSGSYLPLGIASYDGTAPSEPTLEIEVLSTSTYWQYQKDVTVVNNSGRVLQNYPICISLGDVTALIAAGKMRSDLGDIRLQSPGGANKDIFVRDNGGTQTDVKVWFIMFNMTPGETKTLRLLYGNAAATGQAEVTWVRPQFNMFTSDNSQWNYVDFAPIAGQSQSRCMQWNPHLDANINLDYFQAEHPDFTASSDGLQVNAAGAEVINYAPASGYAGMELNTPTGVSQVDFTYRTRTNGGKTPLVLRSRVDGAAWIDKWFDRNDTGQRTTLRYATPSGSTVFWVWNRAGVAVSDTIWIETASGLESHTVSAVGDNPTTGPFIQVSGGGTTDDAEAGSEVTKYPSGVAYGPQTVSWTGTKPTSIMFGLKGERPDFNSGEWYYGGAEYCEVTLDSTLTPTVTLGAETPIFHHVVGTLTNSLTGESIELQTIMNAIGDRIVLDCKNRTCYYYPTGGGPAENRFDAVVPPSTVRRYWVHLEPSTSAQDLDFTGPNLYGLRIRISYPYRYY